MFYHVKDLQYEAKPDRPDALFAKQLQEILGGQYGEISVAMQYLFQGFNVRMDGKYKDLLMDVGTEELAHVEMLATMIARLLDDAPIGDLEEASQDPAMAAILGGMNPQHAIVSGFGAMPVDSVGNRWSADYIGASGNLIADFRANVMAESQGRLQASRLYAASSDRGVRDMLSFLIARDRMHQNMWLAALQELEEKEGVIVPSTFPSEDENKSVAYDFYNLSLGDESSAGRWAHGPSIDGCSTFKYIQNPKPLGGVPHLQAAPPYSFNTNPHIPPQLC
ncbi:manganese catalase family protein [Halalkalibacillus halophilus]|uniref:manganese catalase family protein n=1 Tax=Halalkalibacillus halophilus TaxID=392827 RepID=UPI0004072FD6|nr:manganese catalase family protein [Halalkalibacillus halophilus]